MKKFLFLFSAVSAVLLFSGCATTGEKLPSEDLEVFEKHADIIKILRNPKIPPNSKEKYEAAKELTKHVDLYYTRETATVDKLFYYGDADVDSLETENPTFTFMYQYQDKFIRFRFFTYRMFILRVEIRENE